MYKMILKCAAIAILCCGAIQAKASDAPIKVLCTTFPVFQIARNIVKDSANIDLQLMLPAAMGCPHDYALTPHDMKKLVVAQVLIINGLGLEEFLGAPIKMANPNIQIIDSSTGIKNTLEYSHEGEHHHEDETDGHHHDGEVEHHHEGKADGTHHGGEVEGHHQHEGVNPHIFVSPIMVSEMAMNIAGGLSRIDTKGASDYFKNATEYSRSMMKLNREFVSVGKRLKNNRIIEPHGVFDYLARDMGLDIVAVLQAHGQEPTASKMLGIVKIVESKKPGAIFTEPQYSAKSALTIAKESGLKVVEVDPVASGPADAPIDYYEVTMNQNLKKIVDTLGVQ